MTVPGFNSPRLASSYLRFRSPPAPSLQRHIQLMLLGLPTNAHVCDIGAGVGIFSLAIHAAAPTSVVSCFEPAAAMYRELRRRITLVDAKTVKPYQLTLAQIKRRNQFDLVLLSEAIHLFRETTALLRTLSALVRSRGTIAIRTSSQEQLAARQWYRHFPEARLLDMKRHPPLELVKAALEHLGFVATETVIDESRMCENRQLFALFAAKAFSTLRLLPPKEFAKGLASMRRDLSGPGASWFDYRMTLVCGRR